jgi:DNA helicase HerA-like ATPase
MSDYTLPPCLTLVCGMTGSGKTTLAILYLLNVSAACRFVFDDLGQIASRLRVRHSSTSAELEAALDTRWVVYNPHRMFPGDIASGFRFFCQWAYDCSRRGPGKKVLLVDEAWRFQHNNQVPRELATVAQTGRAENLELVCATQLPHKVHASITGQSTELVCFRLQEPLALKRVQELGADAEVVQGLPLGAFVSWNRLSGAKLDGRVF